MTIKDIELIYTKHITEYLSKGYRINVSTMNGTQGELASVDLTNDIEVIRIMLVSGYRYDYKSLSIVIGRNTNRLHNKLHDTIWNNDLEIIYKKKFTAFDYNSYEFFDISDEVLDKIFQKRRDRVLRRYIPDEPEYTSGTARNIAFRFMRHQPKCKTIKPNQVDKVIKYISEDGKVTWTVLAKGNKYDLK